MILIQFSHPQSVIRERKRGEDWERIWKRFGDAKHSSQELKKEGEIKLLTVCRCLAMQTDFSPETSSGSNIV